MSLSWNLPIKWQVFSPKKNIPSCPFFEGNDFQLRSSFHLFFAKFTEMILLVDLPLGDHFWSFTAAVSLPAIEKAPRNDVEHQLDLAHPWSSIGLWRDMGKSRGFVVTKMRMSGANLFQNDELNRQKWDLTDKSWRFKQHIRWYVVIPSGNLLHSYWKWPVIVDFPIKNGDFP